MVEIWTQQLLEDGGKLLFIISLFNNVSITYVQIIIAS